MSCLLLSSSFSFRLYYYTYALFSSSAEWWMEQIRRVWEGHGGRELECMMKTQLKGDIDRLYNILYNSLL